MRPNHNTLLVIFLLFLLPYIFTTSGHLYTIDSVEVYRTTKNLVTQGTLEIVRPYPLPGVNTKKFYSKYGIGQVLLAMPLYLLADTIEMLGPAQMAQFLSRNYPAGHGSDIHIFFSTLLHAFTTAATAVFLFLIAVEIYHSAGMALILALIYGFSTIAWVYSRDFFQHPLETLCLVLCFYVLFRNRNETQPKHFLWSGFFLAYGILTRINLLVALPSLLIYIFFIEKKKLWRKTFLLKITYFLTPLLGAFLVILVLNFIKYGGIYKFGYFSMDDQSGFSHPLMRGLYGNLFSPGRSLFLFSPPLILSCLGLWRLTKNQREEALFIGATFFGYLAIYSKWYFWNGGWCWGPRFFLPVIPFLILPLGTLIKRASRLAWLLFVAVGAGILLQLLAILVDYNTVYYSWFEKNLIQQDAYIFNWAISPIPTTVKFFLTQGYYDLWLFDIYTRYGLIPPLLISALFLGAMLWCLAFLAEALKLFPYFSQNYCRIARQRVAWLNIALAVGSLLYIIL
jgi:hypothetical protein